MSPYSIVLVSILLTACQGKGAPARERLEQNTQDTIVIRDTLWLRDTVHIYGMASWQEDFGISHNPQLDTVWGRAVDHYIANPDCDALAFDFYYGQFKPSDNALSTEFMELLLSDDDALRPFYRWCFDRTINMADGSLAEYIGSYARRYVKRYPAEFIAFWDSDSLVAHRWAEIIAYSGIHDFQYDMEGADLKLAAEFRSACTPCPDSSLHRLDSFAQLVIKNYEN